MQHEPAKNIASRGAYLVAIQFLLVGLFVLAPEWRPHPLPAPDGANFFPRLALLTLCGITAVLLGTLGSLKLRNYLTPLPYPVDHSRLVTTGVYGIVRHPLYASQLFAAFGWVCYTFSLSHLLLLATAFIFFSFKAGKEERWLTERHPEYSEYARRVKKFIPWVY